MPLDFSGIITVSFDCYGTLIDWEAGILAQRTRHALSGGASHGKAGGAGRPARCFDPTSTPTRLVGSWPRPVAARAADG